jgi:hypothetical protein
VSPLTCADFGARGCCYSCHEDELEGYCDLPEIEGPGGAWARVCCEYLRPYPTPEEWAAALAEPQRVGEPLGSVAAESVLGAQVEHRGHEVTPPQVRHDGANVGAGCELVGGARTP